MGCRVRWRHCLQRPPSSPAAPPGTGSTHILIIGVEGEGDVGRLVERRARREGAVRRRWGGGGARLLLRPLNAPSLLSVLHLQVHLLATIHL